MTDSELLGLETVTELKAEGVLSIEIDYVATTVRDKFNKFVNKSSWVDSYSLAKWICFRPSLIEHKLSKGLAIIKFLK